MELEKYRRVSRALVEAQRTNAELEERVQQKQRELAQQYELVQRLSREAAVAEERRRIMADVHDGIGGQLISALSLIEVGEASKQQVMAALRECIDDLRLVIDSLEPADDELLPVLGNLRYRLEPRLRASGIALDWQIAEVPKLSCLTPQNVLHVLRILQEAFTNVLKHARANCVRVATSIQDDRVSIRISDDGKGFDAGDGRPGYGLINMRDRARRMGAELTIQTSPHGTTLSLLLPLG